MDEIQTNIFRAYDIRGVYPKELNEKTAYYIGRAFVKFLTLLRNQKFSNGKKKRKLNIVVGRDGRLSSPSLKKSLIKGILESGANVIDIGLVTTPMFYFGVAHFKFDGGINISASHNPPQYNGFKIVREEAIPISEKTGLKEIKKLIIRNDFKKAKMGKVIKKEILSDYLKFNLKEIETLKLKPLKIVVDTANAVPAILIPEIFKKIPGKIYHLYPRLDGNFPNHLPDPLIKENLKTLQKKVKKEKANLGIAFDGDGDRIFFVDENGKIISADLILALISDLILKKNPKNKILFDIRSSNIVREIVKNRGGKPVLSRVGHSFIKEKMRKENIIFAGEFSGHYYHKDHYFSEAPIFVFFTILKLLSQEKKPLSQLIKPYQKYFHSGEISFKVKKKERVLEKLERKFKKGKISKIDGLRVNFKDWWFNLRPSQTEPLLRLVLEAKTKKIMEKKKKEITSLIKRFS